MKGISTAFISFAFLVICALSVSSQASGLQINEQKVNEQRVEDKRIYLTSLEWPPYSGAELPQGGAVVAIARQAFANMGYELIVEFYPWSRAVYNAKDSKSRYAGYFPEYYSPELESDFIFSDSIGSGPLGLIEHVSAPVYWQSLQDLKPYALGVVRDYLNTPEFDQAVAEGVLDVQEVTQDVQNIRKVQGKRIPLAVIDANVFQYLMSTDLSLAYARTQVRMNARLLATKQLFVCFNVSKRGTELQMIFNEGLSQLDVDAMLTAYFKEMGLE